MNIKEHDLVVVTVDTATYFKHGVGVSRTMFARNPNGGVEPQYAVTVDEPIIICKHLNDAIMIAGWMNSKRRKKSEGPTRV